MRVTQETKSATRQRILDAARALFAGQGFDATTTRDIARAAGIASGTLFNYFPTKEDVLARLAADASDAAAAEALAQAESGPTPPQTLAEALFALVAAHLRRLKPLRRHLPGLLETALSPLASGPQGEAAALRTGHLEAVVTLAVRHKAGPLSPTALQLYWTLYTGVLVFWANDTSPKQEETLALVDESLNMYVAWLDRQPQSGAAPAAAAS